MPSNQRSSERPPPGLVERDHLSLATPTRKNVLAAVNAHSKRGDHKCPYICTKEHSTPPSRWRSVLPFSASTRVLTASLSTRLPTSPAGRSGRSVLTNSCG